VDRVPIEFAAVARLDDRSLQRNWSKFVSNKCTRYHDKLICSGGLVFDWDQNRVYEWRRESNDA
jgi:hypothetical protein